jgi:hypothetical protein
MSDENSMTREIHRIREIQHEIPMGDSGHQIERNHQKLSERQHFVNDNHQRKFHWKNSDLSE